MDEKIYCGIGKIPKGHRLGSMEECLEKNQVKYWGLKKVDSRIIEANKANKKNKKITKMQDIRIAQVTYRAKIKRKTGEYKQEKNEKKKNAIAKEIEELQVKLAAANEQAKAMEKERDSKKVSKKASKKTSKKASKKTSKKASKKAPAKKTSKKVPVKKTSRKSSKPQKKAPVRKTSRKVKK
jgi:hypothetical protein